MNHVDIHPRSPVVDYDWPSSDVYCVPALVSWAVQQLTGFEVAVSDLAMGLGTRVRESDSNPWLLPMEDAENPSGTTLQAVEDRLPGWSAARGISIRFTYAPLNEVPFGDGETFFAGVRENGGVLGASLDWSQVVGAKGHSLHVAPLLSYRGTTASLASLSGSGRSTRVEIPIVTLERSVASVNGGFWVFQKRIDER